MRTATVAAALLLSSGCSATSDAEIPGPVMFEYSSQGTLFVANKRGASVSRIDLANGEELQRVDTCENPHELSISPDGERLVVACYSGHSAEVYSTADLAPVEVLDLGEGARAHVALWLANDRVLAGAEGRGSIVQLLDVGGRLMGTFEHDSGEYGPHLLVVDVAANRAWGTLIPSGEVVLWDITPGAIRELARARIGNAIEAIALAPDASSLWVSSNEDNMAYRLDPTTLEVKAEVPTGEVPIRLAMHPSGDFVVSSNFGSGDLTVIDTATNEVVRTIPVSGSSDAVQVTLVFSEDGGRLYAAETATDTIAEIDFASGEVLRRLPTGPGGDGLAVLD
ncbi:YncE family protein [Aurantiacibacter zhengii]|uniref:YncE family protein n=1 Tax=Aurantiacibacter zhengii TaxID=2307003 RepID=A0A418NWT3_9SPHN|nr:YncE family protein [Aurantiacibacter zhengii]RIV89066.1 YncE family protein [Aurantiacibacter zhengii]